MTETIGVLPAKAKLRGEMRATRRGIPRSQRQLFDRAIQKRLLITLESLNAKSVAAFSPFDGEPDLMPVLLKLLKSDYQLALPVIDPNDETQMQFHQWTADTRLKRNSFGIDQPLDSPIVNAKSFDFLMVPLVAYDLSGNRLGMGAGYYDRYLESIREFDSPFRLGIAYSAQQQQKIDANEWDVPLHGLINEHGLLTFGQ